MAIDSSIYNALGRGVKTVRDWEAEDEQRAGAAQSRELNALTLQSARDTAEQNALARRRTGEVQSALMGLGPQAKPEQVAGVYSQYGMPDQADKVLTSASTRAKSGSEMLTAGLQRGREMLQFVNSPQAAQRWWQAQYADPVVGPYLQQLGPLEEQFAEIPTDPERFGQWRQAASMLPEKFQELIARQQDSAREQMNKDREFGLKGANSDLVLDPSTGLYVINQPLQSAKVARAAAGAAPASVQPVTYFTAGDGQVYPLPTKVGPGGPGQVAPVTGPGGKPLAGKAGDITEGERNAGGYHARMIEATKLLDKYEESGRQTYGTRALEAVPIVGRAAAGEAMTATQQQYKQAQADWVRAKLRKESGAAIGVDEMAQEIATYFPTPWDGQEVVAQKKKAREVANKAMAGAAGRGVQQQASTAAPAGMPDAAAIDAELARRAKGK